MYNLIFGKRKKFHINKPDDTYKVHYLGNVMTSIMKGDGCVDKAVNILWENHLKYNGNAGIKMKLTLTQGGIRVDTKSSGITEYYGHRIHYIIAHSLHPKLFVWVYQHVGKNLKTEIRCHAVLCKRSEDAKLISFLLNEKLKRVFNEYKREKKRNQNSRLSNLATNGSLPMRKISLRSTNNYKPPIQRGMIGAPKLDDVYEDEEEEEEEVVEVKLNLKKLSNHMKSNYKNKKPKESEISDGEEEEAPQNSTTITLKPNNEELHSNHILKHTTSIEDSSSVYSSTCDSGIEESFTINDEKAKLNEFLNDTEVNKDLNAYNQVSYEFLNDLSETTNEKQVPLIHHNNSHNNLFSHFTHNKTPLTSSLRFRNPFKPTTPALTAGATLHLSSSFSTSSALIKKQRQNEQEKEKLNLNIINHQQQQHHHNHYYLHDQIIKTSLKDIPLATTIINKNFESIAITAN